LLRFADLDHDPMKGVSFKTQTPYSQTYAADDYGRVLVSIRAGQELLGSGFAAGYRPEEVRIPCVRRNYWLELFVMLQREER
jgi:hypothetical protein